MHFVTTSDKTKIYFKDWGTGRPVILIHGWPLSADSWDDQDMAIADAGYRAVAYDRRGFGRSSHARGSVKFMRFFADTFFAKRYGHQAAVLESFRPSHA